jgi:hypothetical protein
MSSPTGNLIPHTQGSVGGYQPSDYASHGGKQNGGSLAFSELKGGKRKSKRASKKGSKKRKTAKRGKKTMKTTMKSLIAIFKKK